MVLGLFSYNPQKPAKVSPCVLNSVKSQFDRIRERVGGLFDRTFHDHAILLFEFFFKDR